MSRFFTALKNRLGSGSGFDTYLVGLQRPCLRSKRTSDCDGIPSPDEARKDYQAALRIRKVLPLP